MNNEVEVELPSSDWTIVVNGEKAGVESLGTIDGNKVVVPAKASYVLVDTNSYNESLKDDDIVGDDETEKGDEEEKNHQ